MQVLPSAYLSDFIKHYLILDVEFNILKKIRYFSNGHSGIVFTIRKEDSKVLYKESFLPNSYVFGQISENQDFVIHSSLSIVIVLFQPYGLYRFTGVPSKELQNRILESTLIFGKGMDELNERLNLTFFPNQIVDHLNLYFANKLKEKQYVIAPFLKGTVQQIFLSKGTVSVNQLTSYSCTSERNLQRAFSNQIGISPKKFIQSVKLHSFLALMGKESKYYYLTRMGIQAGYYDQAHLIREFRKITGITPSAYRKTSTLAVNLIELQ